MGEQRRTDERRPTSTDDDARARARQRLAEREARLNGRPAPQQHAPARSSAPRQASGRSPRPERDAASNPVLAVLGSVVEAVRANPRRVLLAAAAAAALLLVVLIVSAIRGCVAGAPAEPAPAASDEAPATQQVARDPIDEAALSSVLGDDLTASLLAAAESSDDAAWIAAHPDAYAVDGEAVQYKLLKLAATEPEAIPFVRGFPDAYPADAAEATGDPAAGEVPRFYQWDPRWGATVYSSTAFAVTGCCPTSLSMVYQGLTGKGDLSPYDMGVRARDGGYMAEFDGTDSSFLVNEAASLGLSCTSIDADADALRAALEGGAAVICNVGPGDFTDNGHFFVITGVDGDGNLVINDPYSAERSNQAWDVEKVLGQTKALFAYERA
ncbi:C39 family peptidase [Eggerthella sinensis]|uniref:C39 family peptidase n=1 Tax=Eggerthella sinensis TaxID=242230 RepID=UPI00266B8E0C|nr:C39 family peptidase [Eggerthella sinensis]